MTKTTTLRGFIWGIRTGRFACAALNIITDSVIRFVWFVTLIEAKKWRIF